MWVSDECFLLTGLTNIGLVRTGEGQAVLIDSGGDDSSGRRIRKALEAEGLTLQAIYNTHSHADHIGGNAFLQTHEHFLRASAEADGRVKANTAGDVSKVSHVVRDTLKL